MFDYQNTGKTIKILKNNSKVLDYGYLLMGIKQNDKHTFRSSFKLIDIKFK